MKIKIILLAIILYSGISFLFPSATFAQSDICTDGQSLTLDTVNKRYKCTTISAGSLGSGGNVSMTIANASSTGTTVNRLAKLTGAPSTALITSTSDTENAVGIVTSGAGTTGSATIAILGQVSCDFDNATVAGDYFIISVITAGKCHDNGASFPNAAAAYGRVLSTNVSSGTYSVELMTPDIAFQNAGNGKSKPGGSSTDYQINSSGVFGAGTMHQEDANTVGQKNGSTAQTFKVYLNSTNAIQAYLGSGSIPTIEQVGTGGGDLSLRQNNLQIRTGTSGSYSTRWSFHSGGKFYPEGGNNTLDIGDSTHYVKDLYLASTLKMDFGSTFPQILMTQATITTSLPLLSHTVTWSAAGVTFQNIVSNVINTNSAAASSLIDLQVGGTSQFKINKNGSAYNANVITYSTTAPGIAGNATLNSGSKDSAGKITSTGTGASTAVLTFGTAFSNAPACMVTNETTANLVRPVSTTTTLTINATVVTGDSIAYICTGY